MNRIFGTPFAAVYPLYLAKVERKGRTRAELDQVIRVADRVGCGLRVEEIEDPLMQKIRYLDKLVDELAKGKAMGKILREPATVPAR